MTPPNKRRALGRGLSALLPTTPQTGDDAVTREDARAGNSGLHAPASASKRDFFEAQIEDVYPSPEQPRRRFEDSELEELAQSIRTYGIIQPLIVRTRPGGGYFLIAGERRWRASQRAGLHRVPVVVQEVAAKEAFERALVENLQRADLNPIEEAEAYRRLANEFKYTQEQVAERVGKERSTVANSLRLLRLPLKVRRMVEDSALSHGHAKALLALDSDAAIETAARTVINKKLSVRATENLVQKERKKPETPPRPTPSQKSLSVRDLEERLTKTLGAKIQLIEDKKGTGGRIEIKYIDLDDLDRLLARLFGPS